MQPKPYDVVLIPEPKLADFAVQASESLRLAGTHFTLDNRNFFPHISLYMLQLTGDNLNKAVALLADIAHETAIVRAVPKEFHYEDDYVDVEYLKTEDLIILQNKVVERLNPIRSGLLENDKARLASATGQQKANLLEYGYRSVGELFRPHLTFTRFTSPQDQVMNKLPNKNQFAGSFPKLGIFDKGDNGTCVRKVKSWQL